ncbi:MAG: hydroxymethylbilane synthase [Pirellulales bacterium]
MKPPRIRIGTRGSQLARWQADWVESQLQQCGCDVEQVIIETTGDRRLDSIPTLGMQGVFTKEIQLALQRHEIDVAVHSLKDLPTLVEPGLMLACIPPRATPWDLLLSVEGRTLENLPQGARVGTSSRRRRAQLLAVRPDLEIVEVRGNVGTRLGKLDSGQLDALVLAAAGLERLGLANRPAQPLRPPVMLPAAGQGALGLETRADDQSTIEQLASMHDLPTAAAVLAERTVLQVLEAGCLAPVGTWGRLDATGQLELDAVVLTVDGSRQLRASGVGDSSRPVDLGQEVARELLAAGAAELMPR